MDRRSLLAAAGTTLAATLGGCSESGGGSRAGDGGGTPRFLRAGATPESEAARSFLATVRAETEGLYRFTGDDEADRKGFRAGADSWTLLYHGRPHVPDAFRAEVGTLATSFVETRPDGVSLRAESYHECTTGEWGVRADTAAAHDRGALDRAAFVDEVRSRAEITDGC